MSAFQFLQDSTRDIALQRAELENLRVLQTLILLRLMGYPPDLDDIAVSATTYFPWQWTKTWQGHIWLRNTEREFPTWQQLYCWTESLRIRHDLKVATVVAQSQLWVFNVNNYIRPEAAQLHSTTADPETFREPGQSGSPWDQAVAKYEARHLMSEVMKAVSHRPKTAPPR